MALKRNVGLRGFKYRGGGPMLAWILHRLGGLAMVIFVGLHILASFSMQQFGSDLGTTLNIVYESVYFQVILYFFILFHVINGARIAILDLWPRFLEYQREITWLQWGIFISIYLLTAILMIQSAISG